MTRYRGLFWPAVLILVGVVALVVNTGLVPAARLIVLVNLWPVILIVAGLELVVRRTLHGPTADIALAGVVVLAVVFAVVYVAVEPNPSADHTLDASAATGDVRQAAVDISAGSANISIAAGSEDGADLFHAHIQYSGEKPEVNFDRASRTLRISQRSNQLFGAPTPRFVLDLRLNPEVTWKIGESTGASTDTIDATGLRLGAISVSTGASREELSLGPPSGIVPVYFNGGALTVHVHRPSGAEASVTVSGGANSLNADGRKVGGIGQAHYESPGFAGATDAYRISVSGGADSVTVDTAAPSG